jgi:hypothetical protein
MRTKKELEHRLLELEEIVEKCSKAFELIPIWALEKGENWFPSEDAIRLLKKAKDGVTEYTRSRYHGEKNDS